MLFKSRSQPGVAEVDARTGRDFFEGRRIRGWGTDWLWVLPVLLGHGHRSGPILKEPNGSREYAFLF